jgi:hypothetical protein
VVYRATRRSKDDREAARRAADAPLSRPTEQGGGS